MNAFRLYFLVVVLLGGFAFGVARLVPAAVKAQHQSTLVDRARVESAFIGLIEAQRASDRAHAATTVAESAEVKTYLSMSDEERTTVGRTYVRPALERDALRAYETVMVLSRSGSVVDIVSRDSSVDPATWVSRTRGTNAHFGNGVTTYFSVMGTLFASRAEPVRVDGQVVGVAVVVDTYDSAVVTQMRSEPGTFSAFFVGLETYATNLSDTAVQADVGGVVRRTTHETVGSAGQLGLYEVRESDDRLTVLAPIRLGDADRDYASGAPPIGVVVVVDAPRLPNNTLATLVELRAFDDGAGGLWLAILLTLVVLFAGLTLLDRTVTGTVSRLAQRIGATATDNEPVSIVAEDYPSWSRPIAIAFNGFLEAYRMHSPNARKNRAESSAHLFRIDQSGATRPVREPIPLEDDSTDIVVSDVATAERSSAVSFDDIDRATLDNDTGSKPSEEGIGLLRLDTGTQAMSLEPSPIELEESDDQPATDTPAPPTDPVEAVPTAAVSTDDESEATEPQSEAAETQESAEQAEPDPEPASESEPASAQPLFAETSNQDVAAVSSESENESTGDSVDTLERDPDEAPMVTSVPPPSPTAAEEEFERQRTPVAKVSQLLAASGAQSGPFKPVAEEPHGIDAAEGFVLEDSVSKEDVLEMEDHPDVDSSPRSTSANNVFSASSETEKPSSAGAFLGGGDDKDGDWGALMRDVEMSISGVNATVGGTATGGGLELSEDVEPVTGDAVRRGSETLDRTPDTGFDLSASGAPVLQDPTSASLGSTPSSQGLTTGESAAIAAAAEFVSELEREGDSMEREAIVDPQESRTVPRVSLEELNARARAAGGVDEASGDQRALLEAAEQRLRQLQASASQLPGVTEPLDDEADLDASQRTLYEAFRDAKVEAGEDVQRLTYRKFLEKLDRNKRALMARYKCTDVRFDVSVRNGKVTLKATPVR